MAKRETRNGSQGRKIRYAVVGLGWIAQTAILPAFEHAEKNSRLTALVSGDPTKLRKLGRKYDVEHLCSYDQYDELLRSGAIDAVYIALPNSMHMDYTVRAARAGVHVLCEKPMAVSGEECLTMIGACDENKVKLMIAYRLHFDPANMKAAEIIRDGKIGEARVFSSLFSQQVHKGNIRLSDECGGGTVPDMGIYCINAARYLFGAEPTEVTATIARNDEKRFEEIEEMASAILRFPGDRIAMFTCSFGAAPVDQYQIAGTKGDLRMDPAYSFQRPLTLTRTINNKSREQKFPFGDQFAPEILYFSDCIAGDRKPEPSGQEGMMDVRIIEAIYQSARTGATVAIAEPEPKHGPTPKMARTEPPPAKPRMVHATSPSGE
ncbi:MAG: putative glucose-fructose oxidoreductase oxidoreductase protein [Chlorobi bacterium]|nr:putative glucose-fructose oxidoreductase oxidoreductase protein [Chlorobiota bacterium]